MKVSDSLIDWLETMQATIEFRIETDAEPGWERVCEIKLRDYRIKAVAPSFLLAAQAVRRIYEQAHLGD